MAIAWQDISINNNFNVGGDESGMVATGDTAEEDSVQGNSDAESVPEYIDNPTYLTRPNTPTKRRQMSEHWRCILRLQSDHPLATKYTHRCNVKGCTRPGIRLKKEKKHNVVTGSWKISETALNHFVKYHPFSSIAKSVEKKRKIEVGNLATECPSVNMSNFVKKQKTTTNTLPKKPASTERQRALTSAAKYCVYGKSVPRCFEDPTFGAMLDAYWRGTGTAPKLNRKSLQNYIEGEYRKFQYYFKYLVTELWERAYKGPFAQVLHDRVTLDNTNRYLTMALQFVSETFDRNFVISFGFVRIHSSTDAIMADVLKNKFKELSGHELEKVASSCISDAASKGVARELNRPIEICNMHSADKVGSSLSDKIQRYRQRVPFIEGEALIAKVRAIGVFFNSGKRRDRFLQEATRFGPSVLIPVDTRIASQHALLRGAVVATKALQSLTLIKDQDVILKDYKYEPLFSQQYQEMVDMEAILNVTQHITLCVQLEKPLTAALGPALLQQAWDALHADKIQVIDVEAITSSTSMSKLPRKNKDMVDLTSIGKEALAQAIHELRTRFADEQENGEVAITFNDRQLVATALDIRTKKLTHLRLEQQERAMACLKKCYVSFYLQKLKFKREAENLASSSNDMDEFPFLSDDQLSDEEEATEADMQRDVEKATAQYKKVIRRWVKLNFDWVHEFSEVKFASNPPQLHELLSVDIGKIYQKIQDSDPQGDKYGLLPEMARSSYGQIGALNAEHYCERCLSSANIASASDDTFFGEEIIDMLVTLRMNKELMEFMGTEKMVNLLKLYDKDFEETPTTVPIEDENISDTSDAPSFNEKLPCSASSYV